MGRGSGPPEERNDHAAIADGRPPVSAATILVNEAAVATAAPEGRPLLDFVRGELGLVGTKEGCREGDCGACAVIIGEIVEAADGSPQPRYRAHPSCLAFVGELAGRHLLTIEGIAAGAEKAGCEQGLSPVMRALLEKNGSQCGFCSPGFVMSLTAWLLEGSDLSEEGAVKAIDGNLCRCTGYASIRRAARLLIEEFAELPRDPVKRIEALATRGVVPTSALAFARGGMRLEASEAGAFDKAGAFEAGPRLPVGGGSDLAIKTPESLFRTAPRFLRLEEGYRRIWREGDEVSVGAAVSVRDFFASDLLREAVPGIEAFETRFASTLVRNRATVGGNVANASPIADLTPILLALGARLVIEGQKGRRETSLEGFFTGYRRIDLREGEIIAAFVVPRLGPQGFFNFEKLSKRDNLDIATVNTALSLRLSADRSSILEARLSAGGVAPIPLMLGATAAFLRDRPIRIETALEASKIASGEVKPIDDVRGSASYRSEGLERLVLAHFVALRPELAEGLSVALAASIRRGGADAAARGAAGGQR